MTTVDIQLGGQPVTVDPDRLSPTAQALARAIADSPGRQPVDIWVESDAPIADLIPDWRHWYTDEEAKRPDRRPWRGWSAAPLGDQDPHERLEREARKFPIGWHVLGAHPARPLPDAGPVQEFGTDQVLGYLADRGRRITAGTWRGYVSRGQAPQPVRRVGREPLWSLTDIDAWLTKEN